jgi:hypothetical protein
MNRAAIAFAILVSSVTLAAQSANQSANQAANEVRPQLSVQKTTTASDGTTTWTTRPGTQGEIHAVSLMSPLGSCPVSLHARQSGVAARREVGSSQHRPDGVSQSLHLIVDNTESRRIVAANVTVHGFADNSRLVEVLSNQDSSDAAKTFDVRFSANSATEASADLRVPGFAGVSTIDLNSITYADGSIWKLAAGSSCRSWIDGLMLVSSH